MTTVNPTRLTPVANPNLMAVMYHDTQIGAVIKSGKSWKWRTPEDEPSKATFGSEQEAADSLTQKYISEQVAVLGDIYEVVQSIHQTLIEQPQPGHLEVLGQTKRLLSSLNERVSTLANDLDLGEEEVPEV